MLIVDKKIEDLEEVNTGSRKEVNKTKTSNNKEKKKKVIREKLKNSFDAKEAT